MLRKIVRKIKKNPLEVILKKAKKNSHKKFLLAWNRALGDVPLGLYAVVYRIKKYIPDARITFLIREDLKDAFLLLKDIDFIRVPFWRRYMPFDICHSLKLLNQDYRKYDVIIDKVDPNYWVKWQIGNLQPKLIWDKSFDSLANSFNLPKNKIVVALQPTIETKHSPWRSYPKKSFDKLFSKASKDIVFVFLGVDKTLKFDSKNIIDLRGKTSLIEALSIIKNKCEYFLSLDSGLLSLFYYLDVDFPIKLISLWGSKDVGIIKQKVKSPNKKMIYTSLIFENGLENLKPNILEKYLYPKDIEKILLENGQKKILKDFEKFSIEKKRKFIKEIFSLNPKALIRQKAFYQYQKKSIFKNTNENKNLLPLKKSKRATKKDLLTGKKILESTNVGCIILAGGQGSRLGFNGPKALYKINKKTLIEHIIEKISLKQNSLKTKLYISIMTSDQNHSDLVSFFEKNNFFGLKKDQIDFFKQSFVPFLDEKGSWIVSNGSIKTCPDGNGAIFTSFFDANLFYKYKDKKIKYISVIPVDNPIADPFDEKLFGFHKNNKNEITIKCITREKKDEKKGAIATFNNKIKIIEYIDLDGEQNKNYLFSNSGIYLINIDFFKKIQGFDLK
ncbi:MAG: putative uridylyltransferase, partial [Candidatus Anoxychlamydiales bacterium]|nr:putative uridylyltransferase [Candidatus Anoxychlamydiales bacterium]